MALEKQGKLGQAEQAWLAITQRNPKDAAAFASLGFVLSREQNYSEAAAYRKAIALNPKLPGVQLNLGLAEFKQAHFDAAIPPLRAALAALERAVKLDPTQGDAHIRLGNVYQIMGNSAAAEKKFAKVRELKAKQDRDIVSKLGQNPAH